MQKPSIEGKNTRLWAHPHSGIKKRWSPARRRTYTRSQAWELTQGGACTHATEAVAQPWSHATEAGVHWPPFCFLAPVAVSSSS